MMGATPGEAEDGFRITTGPSAQEDRGEEQLRGTVRNSSKAAVGRSPRVSTHQRQEEELAHSDVPGREWPTVENGSREPSRVTPAECPKEQK